MELRLAADAMDRTVSKFTIVHDAEQIIDAYRPLVTDVGADYVAIQIASTDPAEAVELVGRDVLPALSKLNA
jgi:coenzyme F420-dependent glucose-6-phosphate dehydrogenase